MSKQFKLIILTNIAIAILFVVCNIIYGYAASGRNSALWSPLWLTFYNTQKAATIGDIGRQLPNFAFYFFWAAIIINLYFIFKTQNKQS